MGTDTQKANFYAELYHAFVQPNDIEAHRREKGGEWENVPKMFSDQTSGQLQYTCIVSSEAACDLRFRSRSGKLASEWVNVVGDTVYYPALSGDWIGTPGSYSNSGNTGAMAFNGNVNDFVDGPNNGPFWTGLDFGEEKAVYGVRFVPRPDQTGRMVNATFGEGVEIVLQDGGRIVEALAGFVVIVQ